MGINIDKKNSGQASEKYLHTIDHAGKSRKVVVSQCTEISYYLANKRSLHVCSQGLEIPTLIGKNRKIKITHHCHYNKISLKYPCA